MRAAVRTAPRRITFVACGGTIGRRRFAAAVTALDREQRP